MCFVVVFFFAGFQDLAETEEDNHETHETHEKNTKMKAQKAGPVSFAPWFLWSSLKNNPRKHGIEPNQIRTEPETHIAFGASVKVVTLLIDKT